jgi:hypothetical protein
MGGWHRAHLDLMLELTGRSRPLLVYLATAAADDPARILAFHDQSPHVRLCSQLEPPSAHRPSAEPLFAWSSSHRAPRG